MAKRMASHCRASRLCMAEPKRSLGTLPRRVALCTDEHGEQEKNYRGGQAYPRTRTNTGSGRLPRVVVAKPA